jgi:DNA-binding CsgD family transcriptional regulator
VNAGELPPGPIDDGLRLRIERVCADTTRLLGQRAPAVDPGPAGLRALIATCTERLRSDGDAAAVALIDEHQAALSRLQQRFGARFDALARAETAVAELREITSPTEILAHAPEALCSTSSFERAIVSLVRSGAIVAEAAYFADDAASARSVVEQLQAEPMRLEHPLIETELLRRRRATIVPDADVSPRVDRRLARLLGATSYVAAPVVVGSQPVGVIHASRGAGESLDVLDRDVVWEFTSGLAQLYETASLRRRLRREREQMRRFLEWLGARSGELTDAQITLERNNPPTLAPPEPFERPLPPEGRDERAVFEGLLTKRELEVLRLLADGNTNRAIADALVISIGTVKFHVNGILRKLRAANRAEAVARYLRLLGMRTP